jgi:hypothetical protein
LGAKINPVVGCAGRGEKEKDKERYTKIYAVECADRTVCFHLIYQEMQFCGRSPRERVNHVYLVVFMVDVVVFSICYTVVAWLFSLLDI